MNKIAFQVSLLSLLLALACIAPLQVNAQANEVATGTPAFNSFGGGPFDIVNLGNLNVHLTVPVLQKQGRGLPFDFDLTYDSSIWSPAYVSGTNQWQPAGNWGWNTVVNGAALTGYVYYSNVSDSLCLLETGGYFYEYTVSGFVYVDQWGRSHSLSGTLSYATTELSEGQIELIGGGCTPASYTSLTWGISGTTIDGSGISYSFYVTAPGYPSQGTTWNLSTTEASGIIRTPTFQGANTGSALVTDPNGNEITNDTSGHFYDTLSGTTASVTVTGTGSSASPIELTYTGAGGSTNYTVNYIQYTVKTDFGDSSINEYGPLSNPLVSSIVLPDTSQYQFTYERTPGSCTPLSGTYSSYCVTGRIASVTLPSGGRITYSYSGGYNGIESDGSAAGLSRTLNPGGEWQYSRALQTGSVGPGSTWTTTIIDPSANYTVSHFAEDGYTTAPSYYLYETQRQIYQGNVSTTACSSTVTNNCLLLTTVMCYNAQYSGCSTASVSSPITQTDLYSELPGQQPNGGIRLSQIQYNVYGLPTDDKEYNYGVAVGAAPSSTYLVRETAVQYASLGNGIVSMPSSVITYDWSSGTKKEVAGVAYSYDQSAVTATSGTPQHTSVTGSRGNLTTSTSWGLSQTWTYYDTGNVNIATDVNSAQTTYVYGSGSCGNSFPTSLNEPMSLSKSIVWNCTSAVVTQVTDENGNPINVGYGSDPYWRISSSTDQMGSTTGYYYQPNATYQSPMAFGASLSINSTAGVNVGTYYDGLGRAAETQVQQTPSSTTYDTVSNAYDLNGRLASQSTPCVQSIQTECPTAWQTYAYDALNRPLTVTNATGTTIASYTYSYNDVLQAATGTQTFQKQFEYDGLGRLTSVCEISSALPGVGTCGQTSPQTGYWTRYTYDAAGRLLTVTQNAQASSTNQQTRTYVYDLLGRLTSESNPETGSGGQNGTITYTYDSIAPCGDGNNYTSAGDLVQRKDNAGNTTCYSYDALHRNLTAGNSTISGATIRKYFYDSESSYPTGVSVSNGKTQMVEAQTTTTSGSLLTDEYFSFDKDGRETDVYQSTPHSGGYYHSTVAYWPHGVPNTLSVMNSSGTALIPMQTYGVEGEGRPNSVTAASGTSPIPTSPGVTYATSGTSNWIGSITGVTYGSGDSDSFTTNPNTGWFGSYTFTVNTKTDTGTLNWNSNGTLQTLGINDLIHGSDTQNCTYAYDDLARVSSADCVKGSTTLENQTFTYDAFGNITKAGTGTFDPSYVFSNGATTNQFASIPGVTVSYAANGNLLTDNVNTYTWDQNWGNPASVNTTNLTYDALGRMVEQANGSTYTQILYSPIGKTAIMDGQTLTKAFVYLPGGGTAIYKSTGLTYYRHADWLGSSRLTSSKTQTLYSSSSYAPFGEQYATYSNSDPSFTGQNDDTATTLYDFTFREYSQSQGRWISPDPAGLSAVDPTNPQSWNRYAYVLNNPLSFVDAFGIAPLWYYPPITAPDEFDWLGIPVVGGDGIMYFDDGQCINCNSGLVLPPGMSGGEGGGGGVGAPTNCAPLSKGCYNVPTAQQAQQQAWHCLGQAAAAKGLSIALDLAGAVPGFGNLFSGTVEGIQGLNAGYYGLISVMNAGNTVMNPSTSGAASTAATIGLTVGSLALQGSKVIPVVGTLVSLGTAVYDTASAFNIYQQCIAGGG